MKANSFMQQAIELAYENTRKNQGKPFGAVIVKDSVVIGTGVNDVLATHDVTAHAEMQAIREACKTLDSASLEGCEVYASGQPCPMCLAAIYWTGAKTVYYAYTEKDAAEVGMSTKHVYEQLALPFDKQVLPIVHMKNEDEAKNPFALWKQTRG
ncbi:tRNA-specific adenosine deaminase [Brevibacillus reuszeri]|uniref:nucleoside deaminase n=1 Tax=Brevibacillus reuszeri TaxID=54915 RepID=UPI001B1CB5F9|nr:nucleoside deaminase [Brevibacillus reuszeri]GIO09161.1 tRNA-specific adenosine deaminase [Brevibacillus reuszeri]